MIYESGNRIGIWKSLKKEGHIAQRKLIIEFFTSII